MLFQLTKDKFHSEFLGINALKLERMPEYIITPEKLIQKGSLLFEGPADTDKTKFVFTWMAHMAAGIPFVEMTPVRPLKIFYLHAGSIDQNFERKIQKMNIDLNLLPLIYQNLIISQPFKMKLDEEGVEMIAAEIWESFGNNVDIVVVDSIRNFYDGNVKDLRENNEAALVDFEEIQIEALRQSINPDASFILIHDVNKTNTSSGNDDSKILISTKNNKYKLCSKNITRRGRRLKEKFKW